MIRVRHRRRGLRGERGAVTAELALVLPVLVAVTVGLVWLQALGAAQLRAVDAARETARAAARGEDPEAAVARGRAVAPAGSEVVLTGGDGEVVATVSGTVSGPGGLFAALPVPRVSARAVAAVEDR